MQVSVAADLSAVSRLAKTLDKESATALRKRVRNCVKDVGDAMLRDAKSNASWSTGHTSRAPNAKNVVHHVSIGGHPPVGNVHSSIPDSISLKTSFAARSAKVTMKVDKKKAPHAYYWERGSKNGGGRVLRHPVFGRKDKPNDWQESPTRPFFFPSAVKHRDDFKKQLQEALAEVLRELTTAA